MNFDNEGKKHFIREKSRQCGKALMIQTREKLIDVLNTKCKNQIGEQIMSWLDDPSAEVYETQPDEYYVSVHVDGNLEVGFLISNGAY